MLNQTSKTVIASIHTFRLVTSLVRVYSTLVWDFAMPKFGCGLE